MQKHGKTVLVAGGGGFIGGHLTKRLLDDGLQVRCVDARPIDQWQQVFNNAENSIADLRDHRPCRKACDGVSEVYNLAADMGGMGFLERNKARCMVSVLINTNLLRAAREARVDRYFFASSACVYSPANEQGQDVVMFREEHAYPAMPLEGYGWEKLFSERMCRHFHEDYGLNTRVARFNNIYGPYNVWDGGRERVDAALCRKIIRAKHAGQDEIEVWGDGQQQRSFLYVEDCVPGILSLMDSSLSEPINLGSDELVTINELIDVIEQAAGVKMKRTYNLAAPTGLKGRGVDISKARKSLGWAPRIRLREGLEKTYNWIYDEYRKHLKVGS
jgi:nucleoside-diphosphate-sugar epimerase